MQHTCESSAPMLFALAIQPIIVFIKYMRPFNWYSPSPRHLCIRGVTGGEELQVSGYVRNRSCRISGHEAFRLELLCVAPQQYIFSSLLTNRVSSAFPSCFLPFLPTILVLTSGALFDRAVMDKVPLLASLWYNGVSPSEQSHSQTCFCSLCPTTTDVSDLPDVQLLEDFFPGLLSS